MSYREWFWDGPEGHRIFARSWSVIEPRGQIILIHGLAEHSGRYSDLAAYLGQYGWQVAALDLPGHGKTPGRSGHVRSWESLIKTVEAFALRQKVATLPLYLYGHSMGAALAMQIAIENRIGIQGVIASAPPIVLAQPVPSWKKLMARLLIPLFPQIRLDNGINPEFLSRDAKVVKNYLADPLVNNRVSLSLGLGLVEIGPWLMQRAAQLDIPLLLMHGDNDQIADISGSRDFFDLSRATCTLSAWPHFYHELHHDPGWRQVLATVASWLDEQNLDWVATPEPAMT